MVDKPSTSISLSVSVILLLVPLSPCPSLSLSFSCLSFSRFLSLYLSVSFLLPFPSTSLASLVPAHLPPCASTPSPSPPLPPSATSCCLPAPSLSLSSFTLEISITGSTPNPHQPLCHLRPPLSTPSSTPDSLPLGPACCLVACTVSHRCSSLQRQYSSRQLRSAEIGRAHV